MKTGTKRPVAKHRKKPVKRPAPKTATKRRAPKAGAARNRTATSGDLSKKPWQRIQYEDGGHGLFFSVDAFDDLEVERLFEEAEAYPNGYGWESVLAPAFEARFPDMVESVSFDCEADTFVARADDAAVLDALAQVIGEVTAGAEALAAALTRRNPNLD